MKVLAVTNLFPTQAEPTRGTFSRHTLNALAAFDEVEVLVPLPWWVPASPFRSRVHTDRHTGLTAHIATWWSVPGIHGAHAAAMSRSILPRARAIRRTFRFDAVLGIWMYPDAVAAAAIASEFRLPLVLEALGSDINEHAARPRIGAQVRRATERADRVIAVSEALKTRMVELGMDGAKIRVVHNSVDGESFQVRTRAAGRTAVNLEPGGRYVLYVGNLKPEKGPLVLGAAAAAIRDLDDVTILFVGDGPERPALEHLVSERGLEQCIRLVGRRPHEEIPYWMSAADVLCLPSFREGCPNVVGEALASGRPVVASAVGGVPELLSAETGVQVPAGDASALAGGLRDALGRTWDEGALRSSVKSLDWATVGAAFHEELETACRDHSAPGTA